MTDNYPCTPLCQFAHEKTTPMRNGTWVCCTADGLKGRLSGEPCLFYLRIMGEANRRNSERREAEAAERHARRRKPCRRTFACPECGGRRFHIERETGLRSGFFPDFHYCSSCGKWCVSERELVKTVDPDGRTVWSLKDDQEAAP